MPLNCPILAGESLKCRECRHYWDDKCNYAILSPVPVRDILAGKEYAEYLQPVEQEAKTTDTNLYAQVEHLRGLVLHLQAKLNAHLDYKKKPTKSYKGITDEAEYSTDNK